MTREEAIQVLNTYDVNFDEYTAEEIADAIDMAIEALSADTVSREEYEELYRKAKEVNEMANDILADFPSYKELISVANLKEEFESAVSVVRCKDCIHWLQHEQFGFDEDNDEYHDYCALLVPDDDYYAYTRKADDFCSYGEKEDE